MLFKVLIKVLSTYLPFYRFLVRVSYLEIYNEEVRDLLGKDQMQRLEVIRLFTLVTDNKLTFIIAVLVSKLYRLWKKKMFLRDR